MGRIVFVRPEERPFRTAKEISSAEVLEKLTPGEQLAELRLHHPGDVDRIALLEIRFPPDTVIEPHGHEVDEIFVVTAGEIHFGRRVYGIGSSIFIPRLTAYAFRTGPDGLTFLNFRHAREEGVITAAELPARRRAAQAEVTVPAAAPA
jgi:mannose-6-phosphate isomerase-like protein (cupin superfamily)